MTMPDEHGQHLGYSLAAPFFQELGATSKSLGYHRYINGPTMMPFTTAFSSAVAVDHTQNLQKAGNFVITIECHGHKHNFGYRGPSLRSGMSAAVSPPA